MTAIPEPHDEVAAAIKALDLAIAPLIPEVARHLHAAFPQLDPAVRLAAMRSTFRRDWPAVQQKVPILERVDLPNLAAPIDGESDEDACQRCFALLCFATALTAAFVDEELTLEAGVPA